MKNLYYKTLISCFEEIKKLLDKYQHIDDIIAGVQVFGLNDPKLDKIASDWVYKGSFDYNKFITQLTRSIIKLSKNLAMSNRAHGTITIRVDVASFSDDDFDRIMKLMTKDYAKSSRNFKKYVDTITDPGNDGYSFDIDFLISSIYNDCVNQNLFESFNSFAEDYLINLNESADAMYLNLCMKQAAMLIKKYDGTIADITSSLDDVNLAGKLVKTVEKHNSSVSKRRVINMLEESARHVLNTHTIKNILGDSYINILVDFDNINYVVRQLKKDYPEYKNFFTLDFEPYKEGLISVGFVIKVRG